MQKTKSSMGHSKHRKSGVSPMPERTKQQIAREINQAKAKPRRESGMVSSVKEAFRK